MSLAKNAILSFSVFQQSEINAQIPPPIFEDRAGKSKYYLSPSNGQNGQRVRQT